MVRIQMLFLLKMNKEILYVPSMVTVYIKIHKLLPFKNFLKMHHLVNYLDR